MITSNEVNQAHNHVDSALDSYNFFKSVFSKHLDKCGQREVEVLIDAYDGYIEMKKHLAEVLKQYKRQ